MFNKLIGKRVTRKPSKTEGGSDSTTGGLVTLSLPAVTVPKEKPASLNGHFPLTSFRDVAASERPLLLLAKLDFCCLVFEKDGKDKEMKRQTLVELTDYLSSPPPVGGKLTDAALPEFFRMVSANLFRDLPPPSHESTGGVADSFDIEEDEPTMDPSWPHLQIVYELLLRYVVSPEADPKTAKKYIDQSFIIKLLALFDSEDPRERDYLKTVLHRIYGKFMVHRPFIRKAMTNVFYRLVFETERYNGTAELLEILGSIVNGFALPLKEEHKLFLARVLIPLHKPKCVASYHQQLSYCVTQFVEKDFKLADTVIRGLLRFWPLTNSQKEVLFLGELEVILEATQATEFQRCMIPLFRQISRCLNSPHFQVAERTLFLWNNDHILTLVSQNRKAILPLIFGTLEKNAKSHWNKAVHALTINARKMFMDMDPEFFEDCQKRFLEEEAEAEGAEERRAIAWKRLETLALSKASIADPIDTVLDQGKR